MCIYIILYIYLFYLCRFWTITLTFRNTNGWTYCLYLPHTIITKMYFSLLLHNWYPFTDMSIYKPVLFWYIHCTILNMSYFSCMFMLSWFSFVWIEHKKYSGTCLITRCWKTQVSDFTGSTVLHFSLSNDCTIYCSVYLLKDHILFSACPAKWIQ